VILSCLKKHRILAGLTQEELAEKTGVHRDTIIRLEGGKQPPRPRTLKKLADVLGVSTQDLTEASENGTASSQV
jgi:transcriptional regulator with XRE-family HTH domain